MTETPQPQISLMTRLWSAWLGLLIFGGMSVVVYFTFSSLQQSAFQTVDSRATAQIIGALIFIVLTGGAAFFAYRAGHIALAAGLVVGYVQMSVFTSGTCTLLARYENYNVLGGFFYGIALLAIPVLLTIYLIINLIINGFIKGRRSP